MHIHQRYDPHPGLCVRLTTQVLPSAHRGTGNGIAIGLNRIMGIVSAIVGREADVRSLDLFLALLTVLDKYLCPALHLCCIVHHHGHRGRHIPL